MNKEDKFELVWNSTDAGLEHLCAELDRVSQNMGALTKRQRRAHRLRHCEWPGQAPDGRKHAEYLGCDEDEVEPYEGAPDLKVRLADLVISEAVDLLVEAVYRAPVQAQPMEMSDVDQSRESSLLLRYFRDVRLAGELRDEVRLAANYMTGDDPAVAVVGVFWKQSEALEALEYGLEDVAQLSVALLGLPVEGDGAEEMVAQHVQVLTSEATEDVAIRLLQKVFPQEKGAELKKALTKLRMGERVRLRSRYVRENEPRVRVYRPGEDIYFDPECVGLDRSAVFVRETLTEVDLVHRIASEGYSRRGVEELLGSERGAADVRNDEERAEAVELSANAPRKGMTQHDYEVYHCYRWVINEENWLPELMHTVFHHSQQVELKHEPYDYPHAGGPFVLITRERLSRSILDSRSMASVVDSEQTEIKLQRDSRGAATMLSTLPPYLRKHRQKQQKIKFAPMAEILVTRTDDVTWQKPPPFPNGSIELEKTIKEGVDEYFGRNGTGEMASVRLRALVGTFLAGWGEVFARMLACAQAWLDPVVVRDVTGSQSPVKLSREDIRAARDVVLQFDPNDLNVEFLIQKLKVTKDYILPLDEGTIDRAPVVEWAFNALDPRLAQMSVRSKEQAAGAEQKAAVEMLKDVYFGLDPQVPDRGANYALRLQVIEQALLGETEFAKRYASDGDFRTRVERLREQLRDLDEQYRINPQRGRELRPK